MRALDLLPPGMVLLQQWRPGTAEPELPRGRSTRSAESAASPDAQAPRHQYELFHIRLRLHVVKDSSLSIRVRRGGYSDGGHRVARSTHRGGSRGRSRQRQATPARLPPGQVGRSPIHHRPGHRGRRHRQLAVGGERGPTLLEDFHFREKIMRFDHERIPERVVHARGSGAYGEFQVYESLEDITCADFLCDPSLVTPTFVRFSTVVGERGSADTVRDVRASRPSSTPGRAPTTWSPTTSRCSRSRTASFLDFVHAVKPEPRNQIPRHSRRTTPCGTSCRCSPRPCTSSCG